MSDPLVRLGDLLVSRDYVYVIVRSEENEWPECSGFVYCSPVISSPTVWVPTARTWAGWNHEIYR